MDNSIQNALQNLLKNQAAPEEIELLQQAFASGQIFIGGNVRSSVIIVGSGNTVQLSTEALDRLTSANNRSALHQLPQPPADFVGREQELKKVLKSLDRKCGAAISGLVGMGGIGKTALGLVAAHGLVEKYSDAQFFIDLHGTSENPLKPLDVMKHVVQSVYPTTDLKNSTEAELAGTYQSVLAEKKSILFLDNAHDAAQVAPLLPPVNCFMLVTSRWHFTVPGLRSIKLDILKEKDAVQLLVEVCPRINKKAARFIAKLCGYLPIALRLAASYLQIHADWTAEEYIAQLSDQTKRLQALHVEGADASIEASFEQSYQQLPDNEQRLWSMLAIFPASFKRDALVAVWELDNEIVRMLVSKLCQYSLLEYDVVTDRYKLHDLLTDFANTKLVEVDKVKSLLNYFRHYQNIWKIAESFYLQGNDGVTRGLQFFDDEKAHIEFAYEWATTNNTQKEIAILLKDIPDFVEIIRLRLPVSQQLRWFQNSLIAAQKFKDLYNQNKLMGFIGTIYINLNKHIEAIEYYEQALEIARKVDDRQRQGFWLGNIGNAYLNLKETNKAIEYYEQALEIARNVDDRQRQGLWLGNIGNAYASLKENSKALEYYRQALEIACKIGDLRSQSLWLLDIGSVYAELGENSNALEYYEKALKIAIEIGDRKNHALCLSNIGGSYSNLSEYRKGIECYDQALEIARDIGDRQNQGLWLGNIGAAYSNLSEYRKAIAYSEQALEIAHDIGDRQNHTLWLCNIGKAYRNLTEYRKAIVYYEQAFNVFYELGDQHQLAELLFELGYAHGALDEVQPAIARTQESLALARKLGNQYLESVCLAYLGGARIVLDENQKAIRLLKQALKVATQIDNKQQQSQWSDMIGRAYANLGKLVQAKDNFEHSLKISREFGFRSLEADTLFNFAKLAELEQDKKSALQYAQEAIPIYESMKSPHLAEVNQFIESLNQNP